jgi:hypothetical protein
VNNIANRLIEGKLRTRVVAIATGSAPELPAADADETTEAPENEVDEAASDQAEETVDTAESPVLEAGEQAESDSEVRTAP